MKRIIPFLALSLLVLTLCLSASACKKDHDIHNHDDGVEYTVYVVDSDNRPMQNVVVRLLKDGKEVDYALVDASGKASFPQKDPYNYTVTFDSPAGSYDWDTAACTFADDVTSLTVTLRLQGPA